jgi:hypothetical protein
VAAKTYHEFITEWYRTELYPPTRDDVWIAATKAVEEKFTEKLTSQPEHLQLLKAEIAALINEHSPHAKICGGNYSILVRKLRQLSSV